MHRDGSNGSGRRYLTLGAVLALHVVIIAIIMATSRLRAAAMSPANPLEITFLRPEAKPIVRLSSTQERDKIYHAPSPIPPPTPDLELVHPGPSPTQSAAAIDWAQEAQDVAAARAQQSSPRSGKIGRAHV